MRLDRISSLIDSARSNAKSNAKKIDPTRIGLSDVTAAVRRLLHLLARPVKVDRGQGGVVVQPYRGYGSRDEAYLLGRVFRQVGGGTRVREGSLLRDLIDVGRRLLRWGVRDAELVARLGQAEQRVTTDRDGYFRVHLHDVALPPTDDVWHEMELEVVRPEGAEFVGKGRVFVPPAGTRRVVISDIDDTVMYTGVANKVMMLWRLFVEGAESRVAFPGVASLYQALHRGPSGCDHNPMLYVSRGPWNIYEVLEAFFNLHGIPVGPVLFLREWGLTLQRPLPKRSRDHKLDLIRGMLALYDDLPFVLIGDSGQHDPEMYARVVHEHPGRVKAIYIRNVSRDEARDAEIETLAEEVADAGSTLLLAADSFAMAEHAAEHGLIAPEAAADVLAERQAQTGEQAPPLHPTREVEAPTPRRTRDAVERGAVEAAIEQPTGDDAPPNVVVELDDEDADRSGPA